MRNTLVVKLGGGAGLNLSLACADLAQVARERPLVVVHGVSARMEALCNERGIPVEMLTSPSGHQSRYTNPVVRDVFVETSRQVNEEVVNVLRSYGVDAVGITEDVPLQGERKRAIRAVVNSRTRVVRDDYSGSITDVDLTGIEQVLFEGQVAVVPPMAMSVDGLLNVDGDRASASIAQALDADTLVILSNVSGVYRNFPDESSLVRDVPSQEIERVMSWAQGRMKRKVLGAQEAIEGGVHRVVIGDGRIEQPVTQALQGAGTVFRS